MAAIEAENRRLRLELRTVKKEAAEHREELAQEKKSRLEIEKKFAEQSEELAKQGEELKTGSKLINDLRIMRYNLMKALEKEQKKNENEKVAREKKLALLDEKCLQLESELQKSQSGAANDSNET